MNGVLVASEIEETTYTHTTPVEQGVDVEWCVTQVCTAGGESEAGCVTEKCGDVPPPPCNPATDLTVDIDTECVATLTWTAAVGMSGAKYNVYRDDVKIASEVAGTEYVDEDIEADIEYTWTVKTICEEGEATGVDVEGTCSEPSICNPITDLEVVFDDDCAATLTWTAAEDMTDATYNVYRDGEIIAEDIAATEYVDEDIESGVEYTWTVETVCEDGEAEGVDVTGECPVGIKELANSVAIFPNPTNSTINIIAKDFVKVEIYNTVGQLVETKTVKTFDVSNYNTGVYFFKVYDAHNNSVTKRVMVTR
jgi:hypothetical protein